MSSIKYIKMNKKLLFLIPISFLLSACTKQSHRQEVSISNQSSHDLQLIQTTSDTTWFMFAEIKSGENYFSVDEEAWGKGEDFINDIPQMFEFNQIDSIAVSGNHTLTKDIFCSCGWEHMVFNRTWNNSDIRMDFVFDDEDVQ